MHRIAIAIALASISLSAAPAAGAQVSGGAGFVQEGWLQVYTQLRVPDGPPTGDVWGFVSFASKQAAVAGGPVASTQAAGFISFSTYATGRTESFSFVWQDLDPASVVIDPLGNSVTVDMTLAATEGGTKRFAFTMSKPRATNVAHPDTHAPGVNVYTEPGGESSASAWTQAGVLRSNYTVTGDFAGTSVVAAPDGCAGQCGSTMNGTFSGLRADPSVAAP